MLKCVIQVKSLFVIVLGFQDHGVTLPFNFADAVLEASDQFCFRTHFFLELFQVFAEFEVFE